MSPPSPLTFEGQGLSASFTQGNLKIGSFGEAVAYDGGNALEGLGLSLKMSDIAVSVPALPPWASAALPRAVDLNLATSSLDVGKAARVLVEGADVAKDTIVSPETTAGAMVALTPNGPTLAIKPSTLSNDAMTLSMLGAFSGDGSGKARIEVEGLDKEVAALGAGCGGRSDRRAGDADAHHREGARQAAGRRSIEVGGRDRQPQA